MLAERAGPTSPAFGGRSFHWKARFSASVPNKAAVNRLVGAILAEQSEERAACRRYMTLEALVQIGDPEPGPLTIAA